VAAELKEEDVSEEHGPRFRWLERGEGEPVVLLHGLMGDVDHWDAALLDLDDICRPIALSLPIFDPALPETSLAALRAHVRGFLDALSLERAVVAGNSLGGHVALEMAVHHPDRVSGLILTASSGLVERSFTKGVPHRPTAAYIRAKMEETFYDPTLVTPEWVERIRQIVTTRPLAWRVLQFARSARRESIEERLPEVRVPTLLVWGKDDRITPPEVAERFHALIPESELVLLPNCGHAPMLEQPDAFNSVVWWWLHDTRFRRNPPLRGAGALR
jgi:pimeloyl-ACP methyl ester carboxylesterase